MEEPSVLDYLKAKLTPWRGQKIEIPPAESEGETVSLEEAEGPQTQETATSIEGAAIPVPLVSPSIDALARPRPGAFVKSALPWRSLLAVILAITAQGIFFII